MTETVLVVGGTGPTGRPIINALLSRGFRVTMYHTGRHEAEFNEPVEHIHGDPRSVDSLTADLAGRSFDLVISTSGRLRAVATVVGGRTGRLIGVTGMVVYQGMFNTGDQPTPPVPMPETSPPVTRKDPPYDYYWKVARSEDQVRQTAADTNTPLTILRYPIVYGPYSHPAYEWYMVKRVLDGRKAYLMEGDGLNVLQRGAAENVAHAAILAAFAPQAAGEAYNVADSRSLTHRRTVELAGEALGWEWEIIETTRALGPNVNPYSRFRLMLGDVGKMQRDLGYVDQVDVEEATRAAFRWWAENPPPSLEDTGLREPAFDYALEDRYIAAARAADEAGRAVLDSYAPDNATG